MQVVLLTLLASVKSLTFGPRKQALTIGSSSVCSFIYLFLFKFNSSSFLELSGLSCVKLGIDTSKYIDT